MSNLRVGIIEDEVPAARLLERMVKQVRPNWDLLYFSIEGYGI